MFCALYFLTVLAKYQLSHRDLDSDFLAISTGLPAFLFALVAVMDPGVANFKLEDNKMKHIHSEDQRIMDDESKSGTNEDRSVLQKRKFCLVCGIHQEKGTVHCAVSNICIKNYLQYSTLIDKPIGKYNIIPALLGITLFIGNGLMHAALFLYHLF